MQCDYYERMRPNRYVSVLSLALSAMLPSARLATRRRLHSEYLVYFGTYTDKGSKGIYACRFRPSTGKLTPVELAAETVSPSFLAVDPAQRYLFAANEIGDYQKRQERIGLVHSRSTGIPGKLRALNTVASRGADPCHLTVDKTGSHVLVANYTGGSVAVLPVEARTACWARLRTLCSIWAPAWIPSGKRNRTRTTWC